MCKPPAAQARANTFADESTPLPCGPPIIQERSFTFAAEELIGSCRPQAFLGVYQFPIPREGHAGRPALYLVDGSAWSEHEVRDARAPYQSFPPDSAGENSFAAFPTEDLATTGRFSARDPVAGRAAA